MVDSILYSLDAYHYELPERLIAKHPIEQRDQSRLFDCSQNQMTHRCFTELANVLQPGDLLVLNDTQVLKSRLYGHKESGGRVEVFVIQHHEQQGTAFIKASKSPKPGSVLTVVTHEGQAAKPGSITVKSQNPDGTYLIEYTGDWLALFEAAGHIPLPPYMDRDAEQSDEVRYQTVWAAKPGAVAAPTASLHFTQELLQVLQDKGVDRGYLTLHVGAGTFAPVRVDDIREHHMHSEVYQVSQALIDQIQKTKAAGGRVIAVGTTALRTLETLGQQTPIADLQASSGDTSIFIYPGFQFTIVDLLLTNFHLPKSTLLMLVSAFAGKSVIDQAYQTAIEEEYRFFSYGDAMLLSCKNGERTDDI